MSGRREPLLYVNDMYDAAVRIIDVCSDVPDELLRRDVNRMDVVLWRLTVLGEAAKTVPAELRAANPQVPWASAARLRDRIVHHYEGVDHDAIISVVRRDLPALLAMLEPLRAELREAWDRRQAALGEPPDW